MGWSGGGLGWSVWLGWSGWPRVVGVAWGGWGGRGGLGWSEWPGLNPFHYYPLSSILPHSPPFPTSSPPLPLLLISLSRQSRLHNIGGSAVSMELYNVCGSLQRPWLSTMSVVLQYPWLYNFPSKATQVRVLRLNIGSMVSVRVRLRFMVRFRFKVRLTIMVKFG